MQLINDEIKIKKKKLTINYKNCQTMMSLLHDNITGLTLIKLKSIFKQLIEQKLFKWTITHNNKLHMLRNEKTSSHKQTTNAEKLNIIKNLSSRQLNNDETSALEHGLDYVFPPTKFDDQTFISNIENFFVNILGHTTDKRDYEEINADEQTIYNLTPTQLEYAKKIRSSCNSFRKIAMKEITNQHHISKRTEKTLKNLSKDKSIIITRPDKGRGIVIINQSDYVKKMNDILSDTKTFRQIDEDPTIKQENKLNSKLSQLKNDNFLTTEDYNYAKSRGSQPGRIYALPKIHKQPDPDGIIPFRPIVSSSNTYNHKLAKLLANKLDYLRKNSTIVNDTFSFVEWLHKLKIDPNEHKLFSFDITSLFTKVPLDRTIEIILEKLYDKKHTCIVSKKPKTTWCDKCKNRYEMKFLLELATKETHFIFNNKTYCQINGVAMGSPLGPLFADIYINYLEQKFMKRITKNGVEHYKRFVDDTFVIAHKDTNIKTILDILNSYDVEIQFTCEEEKDHTLSFLDVKIQRTTSLLTPFITSIYRKPSFTGLILKWSSYVPKTYKVSAISSMIYRAIKICSTFDLMVDEFNFIRNIALKNEYPINFIESQIRKTLNRYYNSSNELKPTKPVSTMPDTKKTTQLYIDIPYFGPTTNKFGKKLIKFASSTQPLLSVQPIQRPAPAISSLFSLKDKIPISLQSGVVYKIPCHDCAASYIGKTIRHVQRRLYEHGKPTSLEESTTVPVSTTQDTVNDLRRSTRTRKLIERYGTLPIENQNKHIDENLRKETKTLQSALFKHQVDNQHKINWNDIKIIDKDPQPYRLLIRESLAIKQLKPTLNRTVNSAPLLVYPEGLMKNTPTTKPERTVTASTNHGGGNEVK
ncbi:unnamed protein product [Adineta ricciae]|nr:unnamed protein product [Adineta ricciae]